MAEFSPRKRGIIVALSQEGVRQCDIAKSEWNPIWSVKGAEEIQGNWISC